MIYDCPDILKNKRLISLDIETTGININFSTIIELGVVEVKNGKIVQEYSRMFGGGHSSMYLVRNIHHIKDCERKGLKTFKQCAEKISLYLSDAILVTHNGNKFDIPMIQAKLNDVGFRIERFTSIDTYQLSKKIGHESNSLQNLCKQYDLQYGGEDGNNAHRGL